MTMKEQFTIENAVAKPAAQEVVSMLSGRRVILASGSPRRRRVLELLGIDFETYQPVIDENIPPGIAPPAIAETLAAEKVRHALDHSRGCPVIGADTLVILGHEILGKPVEAEDALRILKLLRGLRHRVITGIAVSVNGSDKISTSHEVTDVIFREFSDGELDEYIASGEPFDKAGAYGIQGMGSVLVDHIEGELDNVIGFPLDCLAKILARKFPE